MNLTSKPMRLTTGTLTLEWGDPSKGMFQMIGSSFRAYAKPGHGNILNPTDEAISAMRYIVGKWVPIMGSWRSAFKRAGDYAYATGGVINTSGMYQLAEGVIQKL